MPLNRPSGSDPINSHSGSDYSIQEVVMAAIANPVYDGRPAPEPIEQTFARLRNKIDQITTDLSQSHRATEKTKS